MKRSFGNLVGLSAFVLGAFANSMPVSAGTMAGNFTSYAVSQASPHGIVYFNAGPLKGVWFTNSTSDAKSGVVEFFPKTGKNIFHATPTAGAVNGSINFFPGKEPLWFTETKANKIARIDSSKKLTEFAIPTKGSKPFDIQHGPGDSMWFTESGVGKIGKIDPAGKITEYTVGAKNDAPTSLMEQDGAIWFTEVGSSRIGRLDPKSGQVKHFATGSGKLTGDITNSNDGALWAPTKNSVVRLKTDGTLKEFPLPGVVNTGAIFGNADGVYIGAIKADGQGLILSISGTGEIQEYNLPKKHLLPAAMAIDPEGGFFMTVSSAKPGQSVSMIWRLQLPAAKQK